MKKKIVDNLILPSGGIDTHAHLDLEDFSEDLDAVIKRAELKGVTYIVNVFLDIDSYNNKRKLFEKYQNIYFTLGIHPHEASKVDEKDINSMIEIFKDDSRLRAVGEIGLDFYRNYSPKSDQIKVFKLQLEIAKQLDIPVVIHSRDAESDTLKILEDMGFKDRPLIWHCFTKDIDLGEKILKNGWMISIPGPITFKKSEKLQIAVSKIPLKRMVVETDSPFLTPHPFRGKRNEPGYVVYTAKKIAEIKNMDVNTTWKILSNNAKEIFNI